MTFLLDFSTVECFPMSRIGSESVVEMEKLCWDVSLRYGRIDDMFLNPKFRCSRSIVKYTSLGSEDIGLSCTRKEGLGIADAGEVDDLDEGDVSWGSLVMRLR